MGSFSVGNGPDGQLHPDDAPHLYDAHDPDDARHPDDAPHPYDVDVLIVGGGIAGLATAHFLSRIRPELRVEVIESSAAVGGKISGATVAGIGVDTGPDAFLARVPGAVELAESLGFGDDLVAPATGSAYVYSRGKLRALPKGLVLGVPSDLGGMRRSGIISARGIARAALGNVLPHRATTGDDPSVSEAIGRHLGREVVERLVDPLLGGINASDCDSLSLSSASPMLAAAAREPRLVRALRHANAAADRGQIGVTETRPVFLAPRTGIRALIARLGTQANVSVGETVTSITRTGSGWSVTTSNRTGADRPNAHRPGADRHISVRQVSARHVVMATPASSAARLLNAVAPQTARDLETIRTASVALTLLAYPAGSVSLPPGSGMLVPRPEHRLVTASSWWNQKWPHLDTNGHVLLRASAGRDGDTRFSELNDDELVDALHRELTEMLGITAPPVDAVVTRWMGGFPQYDTGHSALVGRIEKRLATEAPGVTLVGASYRGIGIPACIRDAERAAGQVNEALGGG